jgi:hydroxymethylbilane synthase
VKLRIATRKSRLALAQTRWVAERLMALRDDLVIEEVPIMTEGDRVLDRPLSSIGGKGLFVSEVEATLLDGRADIAVHSMKDVPAALAAGLGIIAIPEREDPRDVLVTRDGLELDDLEAGARIGTSSLRRSAQLRHLRPDLAFNTLRGNVDTRLRKLDEGAYEAIVLAAAGMRRLSLLDRPHWIIPEHACIPAVGQGALGIEVRLDDEATVALVRRLDHPVARAEVEAERALLVELEGSCKVPIAGHGKLTPDSGRFTFHAMVASLDGNRILTKAADTYLQARTDADRIDQARAVGHEAALSLVAEGARDLVRDALATVERQHKQGNGGGPDGNRFGRWS